MVDDQSTMRFRKSSSLSVEYQAAACHQCSKDKIGEKAEFNLTRSCACVAASPHLCHSLQKILTHRWAIEWKLVNRPHLSNKWTRPIPLLISEVSTHNSIQRRNQSMNIDGHQVKSASRIRESNRRHLVNFQSYGIYLSSETIRYASHSAIRSMSFT